LQVEFQVFTAGGQYTALTNMKNVICKKHPPSGATTSVFVIGAHYDSTAESSARAQTAPGAVDNGSGAAGVLAIAQAVQGVSLEQTVHFVFFGAEELGIYGSSHYINTAISEGLIVVSGAAIMDMIGYSGTYFGVTVEYQGGSTGTALAQNAVENFNSYGIQGSNYGDGSGAALSYRYMYSPWGSDHVPFIQASVPCFLAIQREDINYYAYHSVQDTEDTMNYDQAMGILRMMVSTLYDNTCSPEEEAPTPAPTLPPTTTPTEETPPETVICESTRGIRPLPTFTCSSNPVRERRSPFPPN